MNKFGDKIFFDDGEVLDTAPKKTFKDFVVSALAELEKSNKDDYTITIKNRIVNLVYNYKCFDGIFEEMCNYDICNRIESYTFTDALLCLALLQFEVQEQTENYTYLPSASKIISLVSRHLQ